MYFYHFFRVCTSNSQNLFENGTSHDLSNKVRDISTCVHVHIYKLVHVPVQCTPYASTLYMYININLYMYSVLQSKYTVLVHINLLYI